MLSGYFSRKAFMDFVTHGLLGSVVALTTKSKARAQVALCGAVGAVLPDADVLINSATDPLLVLEHHRQFSHSLFVAPVGALLGSLLLAVLFKLPVLRRQLPWHWVYLVTLAGYLSAILLDLCTSYGTALLWPFYPPVALSIIAVVDPIFTFILLATVAGSCFWRRAGIAKVGLGIALFYLLVAQLQQLRATAVAVDLANSRGTESQKLIVKPTMGNIVLWRALTIADGEIRADAIRVGLGSPKVYHGEQRKLLQPADWSPLPPNSAARRDTVRFYALSDELLVRHPENPNMIGDARYSMLPTSTSPIWGIVIDPASPNQGAVLFTRREFTPLMRRDFVNMLRGAEPDLTVPHGS